MSYGRFKRRLVNFLSIEYWTQSGYELTKGKEAFWISISRDHDFFFLAL